MIKKIEHKKSIAEIFRENDAAFSITLSEGFANITFNDKQEMRVQFLNEEGYHDEEMEVALKDVEKVSKFMTDMKSMRLEEYKSN